MANDVINILIQELDEIANVIINSEECTVSITVEEVGVKGNDGLGSAEAQQIRDDLDDLETRLEQLENQNLVPFFELPELP